MNAAHLTAAAERAGVRYTTLLGAFGTVFAHFAGMSDPGSDGVRKAAVAQSYSLAERYLVSEADYISSDIERQRDGAIKETLTALGVSDGLASETTIEHADLIASELEGTLRVQLERDISALVKGLRDIALRASLVGRARGISRLSALAAMRADNAPQTPQFAFLDRAGRRWSSERLIKTVWRHALVLTWNETALLTMSEYNVTDAQIEHPDENYAELGTVISLAENAAGITWSQVRDDLFHPNSNAWLTPVI